MTVIPLLLLSSFPPPLLLSMKKGSNEFSIQDPQRPSSGDLVDFAMLKQQEDEFNILSPPFF